MAEKPVLEVVRLVTQFRSKRKLLAAPKPPIRAVDDVSFSVARGEIFGIVGESGSGKSTLAKTILGLYAETSGDILLDGGPTKGNSAKERRRQRSAIQYVHQDPGAALDPWWRIGNTLREALIIHGNRNPEEREHLIDRTLEAVGLSPEFKDRYPHELSGGQQRRIGIARTLILRPAIVILDEPTSGLDMAVQKAVLSLAYGIRREFNLTYLFISHDLSVVRHFCDRVAIMCRGKIVEAGPTAEIFERPRNDYTQKLLASAPSLTSGRLVAATAE